MENKFLRTKEANKIEYSPALDPLEEEPLDEESLDAFVNNAEPNSNQKSDKNSKKSEYINQDAQA